MAYTRTNWVEEETPLSAQNLNNIEDGIEELQAQKVDKVSGKALSDNNYTNAEKTKLAGIAEGAEVNRTYTAVSGYPTSNVAPGFGQTAAVSQVSQDENGQITLTNRTITIPNKVATTAAPGLMSAADKSKLDGIEAGAQVNPGVATTSANGLMSLTDKTKLNNVSIRIATAATLSSVAIPYRETKTVQFKYKTSGDSFSSTAMVVPIDIPEFSNGLAINSYYHETGYFYIRLTNTNPNTRTVSSGKDIRLLVIDKSV